jgi:signal transduction histidine kinase
VTDPRPSRASAPASGEPAALSLDDVPAAALIVEDATQRVVAANRAAHRIHGAAPGDLVGVPFADLVARDAGTSSPAAPRAGTATLVRRDGTTFPASIRVGAVAGDAVAGTVVLVLPMPAAPAATAEETPSREDLRDFARRLQAVREAEQERIGREVHDEIGQALAALRMNLSWLEGRLAGRGTAPLRARVGEMIVDVDEAIAGVRRVARELRPPILERLGLSSALRDLAERTLVVAGIPCDIHLGFDENRVDRERAIAVYRLVQEALTNVLGHAKAGRAAVTVVEEHDALIAQVLDDGVGIPTPSVHDPKAMGLMGMRERARVFGGDVSIRGDVGGTSIVARIPLAPKKEGTT